MNAGVDPTPALPLNVATVVKIQTMGEKYFVSYNNKEVALVFPVGNRLSGFANLFVARGAAPNALFGKLSFA